MENTFGLLVARFRILQTGMNFKLETSKLVTMACCVLHNLCLKLYPPIEKDLDQYNEEGKLIQEGQWHEGIRELHTLQKKARKFSDKVKHQRSVIASYFMKAGKISWQRQSVLHQYSTQS